MRTVTAPYDVAEHLRAPEEMATYLEVSIEEADGDITFIANALCNIARAKGLSHVTKELGLYPENMGEVHSEKRNPTLTTVLKAIDTLGFKVSVEALHNY